VLNKSQSSLILCLLTSVLAGCLDPVEQSGFTQAPLPPSPPVTTNAPPSISGSPSNNAAVGETWSFTPSSSDPDGDVLTFAVENQPAWANFDGATGRLSGVPQLGQQGDYSNILISVNDGQMSAALPGFKITVESASSNNAPTISGTPPVAVLVGQAYLFTPNASDPDGDNLTFSIANQPSWATFSSATVQLGGTPTAVDARQYANIVISVSDGAQSTSLPAFTIDVQSPAPSNRAPQISGSASPNATIGQLYMFQPGASDPDGDDLTFLITNQPSWASFDSATGMLVGTPAEGDEGVHQGIVISVSDGMLSASLPGFEITVVADDSNNAPRISGNPPTSATVNQQYVFQPSASDPDGDDLTFLITNQPSWASFNSGTGMLSGTPADGNEGAYPGIVISVSDGKLSASLPGFEITVVADDSNNAPSISGNPPTSATVDQQYLFQPGASDPDGDDLTFLIDNQPSWISFSSVSGQLSGTPVQGDAAVYENIVISVSDGDLTASLPTFSITVSQAATGSVTLTWTAPTTNTDGSQLTDLAAYKIYYGTTQGNYPNEVRIDNPGITTYVIDNLSANTYFFVSTSINSLEIESDYSNVASKIVN